MKTRIYVVEDMAYTRITLIDNLIEANFEVVGSAANAETAWKEMQTVKFDLALLDINLAGANDGVWLAEKIVGLIDNDKQGEAALKLALKNWKKK